MCNIFGGNFSLILQANSTTKGTLSFEYNRMELSDADMEMETVNVTADRVQIISLAPAYNQSRRLILVNSTDPVSCFFLY